MLSGRGGLGKSRLGVQGSFSKRRMLKVQPQEHKLVSQVMKRMNLAREGAGRGPGGGRGGHSEAERTAQRGVRSGAGWVGTGRGG